MENLSQYKNVWVFAEQKQGTISPVVIELLGEGKKIAKKLGVELCAILLGKDMKASAKELMEYGVDKIYLADDNLLNDYTTDFYTTVISDAIEEIKPEVVLYGATHIGRDLAPRVAARINTGLTADCTDLDIDLENRNLLQTRPAFGGNLMATIVCQNHRPQMATVRPGVMEKSKKNKNYKGEIIELEIELSPENIRTQIVNMIKSKSEAVSLKDAEIIVSGGKGLGEAEGFELIKKFANTLEGTVGASRAAVDAGWIKKNHQVGQTGSTVRPKIYIACGISGAIQHLAGMKESDIIIAINKDKEAPIFEVANFGIVEDLYEAIPKLIKTFKKEAHDKIL